MNIVLLICLIIIWGAGLYGFQDDMDCGLFGRLYAALAHMAMAVITLAGVGGLLFLTFLTLKEFVA